jgi:hypothetical protein
MRDFIVANLGFHSDRTILDNSFPTDEDIVRLFNEFEDADPLINYLVNRFHFSRAAADVIANVFRNDYRRRE